MACGEHLGESAALLCAGAGELSLDSFFPSPRALPAQEGWPLSAQLLFTHLHGSSFLETFVAEHPAPGSQQCLSLMSRGPETLPAHRADIKHGLCSENPGLFHR